MKKLLSCLLAVALLTMVLAGCGNQPAADTSTGDENLAISDGEKIKIVSTIFPQYDWVQQILGDNAGNAQLTLLLDSGVDLHSYQPTADDIITISTCDMFLYVGGESDGWVEAALETATNPDMIVINLMDVLGDIVREEEIVEGMQHDHDHADEEFDPDNVYDRPLSDWAGDWNTIEQTLHSGELDEYISAQAEENGTDFDSQRTALEARWLSNYEALNITDTSISFDGASSEYNYLGYKIVESDHGGSAWYGFEAATPSEDIPQFIAFADHGTGHDDEHGHEDEHADEHDHIPHYHIRYGNDSFDALVEMEDWSPTYFPADANGTEIAEAMSGHGHHHEEEHDEHDEHSHEGELDEHVWLSLKNAQIICPYIANKLAEIDAENADVYKSNAESYCVELAALDAEYKAAVDAATVNTLLFADRFPFRYLVDDYGIDYYAAFSGCSAETEASFETIVFLAGKVDELVLSNIMVIENSDQSIARTVSENTAAKNQQVLVLDSIQSVTSSDISGGTSYLSIMESNLEVLKDALG